MSNRQQLIIVTIGVFLFSLPFVFELFNANEFPVTTINQLLFKIGEVLILLSMPIYIIANFSTTSHNWADKFIKIYLLVTIFFLAILVVLIFLGQYVWGVIPACGLIFYILLVLIFLEKFTQFRRQFTKGATSTKDKSAL